MANKITAQQAKDIKHFLFDFLKGNRSKKISFYYHDQQCLEVRFIEQFIKKIDVFLKSNIKPKTDFTDQLLAYFNSYPQTKNIINGMVKDFKDMSTNKEVITILTNLVKVSTEA